MGPLLTALLLAQALATDAGNIGLKDTGDVQLPAMTIRLHETLVVPPRAHDLVIDGNGATLEPADDFRGTALVALTDGQNVTLRNLKLNAEHSTKPLTGITAANTTNLTIDGIQAQNIANGIQISGSTTGHVTNNRFLEITHIPVELIGSTGFTVESNRGARIGFGESQQPAALAAKQSQRTVFKDNSFEEVNGTCIRVEDFHDGEVRSNSCVNREDREAYTWGGFGIAIQGAEARNVLVWGNTIEGFLRGGLLLSGAGHRVSRNHFTRLNIAHCNEAGARFLCLAKPKEPDLFRSGVYLAHPARDITVEANELSGFGIGTRRSLARRRRRIQFLRPRTS
jgi:hypothetical protein